MSKQNKSDRDLQPPTSDPKTIAALESQAHKVVFLNSVIIRVDSEEHLNSAMEIEFINEGLHGMFDDMKKTTKIPLLSYLNDCAIKETNILKQLTKGV